MVAESLNKKLNEAGTLADTPSDLSSLPTSYTREELIQMYRQTYDCSIKGDRPSPAAAASAVTGIAKLKGFLKDDDDPNDLTKSKTLVFVNFAGAFQPEGITRP